MGQLSEWIVNVETMDWIQGQIAVEKGVRRLACMLDEPERLLLKLLCEALTGMSGKRTGTRKRNYSDACLEQAVELAGRHAVLPLLYDVLEKEEDLPQKIWQSVDNSGKVTARSNYRLLFLTKYVTGLLEKNGILAVVLKGAATAAFYPVPELRKAGDIDILVPEKADYEKACLLLQQDGFHVLENQSALHHMELQNDEGISVEVHGFLVEPFESRNINSYLKSLLPEYGRHWIVNTSWGILFYQPSDAYHAFYLLLHMLQHFLRAGFGLKFLCDWVVFWNREIEQAEKRQFLKMVRESGTEGFVRILTQSCVKYLGLKRENVQFMLEEPVKEDFVEDFYREVFQAGEFGRAKQNRMVAMRGTGVKSYVMEFHHQMRLNYPKAGKVPVIWPVLWVFTLVRFLYNNHAVRKVSGREILKEAGRRSRLISKMRLFE